MLAAVAPASADERMILGAGFTAVQRPTATEIDRPLLGPTLSGTFLEIEHDDWRLRPGIDVQLTTTFRSDRLWLADLSVAWVATLALTEIACNPFVSFGGVTGFVGTDDGGEARWAVGVRADAGLHGILFDGLYWRAKVGFVAVGVAGIRYEVMVGHAFD